MSNEISERIRYLRLKNNMTAKDLSAVLGTSDSAISLYENGKRKPSIDLVVKMADFFDVTTDYILGVNHDDSSSKEKIIGIDFSEALERMINYLNKNNTIIFDRRQLDKNMKIILLKNISNVLDNMRLFINN